MSSDKNRDTILNVIDIIKFVQETLYNVDKENTVALLTTARELLLFIINDEIKGDEINV